MNELAFKIPNKNVFIPTSSIELFNKLGKIERLSLQQGQSLEEYEKLSGDFTDIAIEMPAGHGKTLVGGLIAEYRRLNKKWRVVFCCATRQLAAQTHNLLGSYGIKSVLLTGKAKDFPERSYREYNRSSAIAVTTYSHIFNINPAFNDANLIIFDDAHATEYSINDFWTLEVKKNKERQTEIFNAIYAILKDGIPKHIQDKIEYGTYDPMTDGIDIIPQPLWLNKIEDIRGYLDQATNGNDLYFKWSKIRNILHGCNIFLTHNKITFKPIVTPNKLHLPFNNATERVYMSATLGPEGELERVFGINEIKRISKFSKGANKVSGRRLILFPEDHFENEAIITSVVEAIKMQPRALFLFPSNELLDSFKNYLEKTLPEYRIFLDSNIEVSLDEFKNCNKGLLLLSGRYEGIDLKDEDCRLQIFVDLPIAVGVSEQFLQSRLKASEILKNRLATRIIQGLGRCTRGTNDYAAVLFLGRRVGEYLYKNDFRELLPPEIDAELEFGFQQIDNIKDINNWKDSLQTFFDQGEDWQEVEDYIRETTNEKQIERETLKIDNSIQRCAINEVEFQYRLLEKNYEKAHEEANKILNTIGRNPLYGGYRAWWNYYIACVGNQQGNIEKTKEFLVKAINASINKTWIDRDLLDLKLSEDNTFSLEVELQLENIISKLKVYGDRDKRFEKDWQKVVNGLNQKKAQLFESSLVELGDFLGVRTFRPEGHGTPDGIWNFMNYWAVFEAKTNIEDPTKEIPLDDIRQAGYHEKWIKTHLNVQDGADIRACIICEKNFIREYAMHAADDLFLISPSDLITKANHFGDILRTTIQKMKFSTEIDAKEFLAKSLISLNLTVIEFMEWMKTTELKEIIK